MWLRLPLWIPKDLPALALRAPSARALKNAFSPPSLRLPPRPYLPAQQMAAEAQNLGDTRIWQPTRPSLSTAVTEERRKNGYW